MSSFSVFDPSSAKGGGTFNKAKTAVCFIEYQNEFATEKGKMHDAVKEVMAETGMLIKSAAVAAAAREAGAKVFHIGMYPLAWALSPPPPRRGLQ
jgi:nicotinamidase-related amidase